MSYALAMERLLALAGELHTPAWAPRRKFRLEDMRVLLARLGDPQKSFPSVLIAGTNGKGSTAATLASILRSAGYRTGLYTSPHLERPNERIQIDGEEIDDHSFASHFFRVESAGRELVEGGELPALPSFFEAVTAMAFLHFAGLPRNNAAGAAEQTIHGDVTDLPVDIAVLEVGMGGRLDATNVVEPLLSIVTDISLDHTEWLGSTIDAIAREKAGILRQNGMMITLPQHPEASQALGEVAIALGVRAVNAAEYIPSQGQPERFTRNRYPLTVLGRQIEVDSPLAGRHQQRNIALAIAAAVELNTVTNTSNGHGYNISASQIEDGIRETVWPVRLERIREGTLERTLGRTLEPTLERTVEPTLEPILDPILEHAPRAGTAGARQPEVLLDVAHNPAGAWALRSAISTLLGDGERPLTLIFGCLKDKAIGEIAQILFPLFNEVVLTRVDSPRAASIDEMLAAASQTGAIATVESDAPRALARAFELTPPGGLVVATGSFYLVGQVRSLLKAAGVAREVRSRGRVEAQASEAVEFAAGPLAVKQADGR
ncbi:MAG TPA: folylpolyglutamate synthase/dihydrofolate synthase family protein [Acidisarcina sp.]